MIRTSLHAEEAIQSFDYSFKLSSKQGKKVVIIERIDIL